MTILNEHPHPFCFNCKVNKAKKHGKSKKGFQQYSSYCSSCEDKLYNKFNGSRFLKYKQIEGDKCSRCGFIPEHPCQLDRDHKDGNRYNSNPINIQVLCANCHRLKTCKPEVFTQKETLN